MGLSPPPPTPQAFALSLCSPSLLTGQFRGPLFREAFLDVNSVGILFLYYFPVEEEMASFVPSSHSQVSRPVSTSYLELAEGRAMPSFLVLAPSGPSMTSGSLS